MLMTGAEFFPLQLSQTGALAKDTSSLEDQHAVVEPHAEETIVPETAAKPRVLSQNVLQGTVLLQSGVKNETVQEEGTSHRHYLALKNAGKNVFCTDFE